MKPEELLKGQWHLASTIENLKKNLLATPNKILSTVFLRSKADLLNSYFKNFRDNHMKLIIHSGLEQEEYFTNDQFSITEASFTEALTHTYNERSRIEKSTTASRDQVNVIRSNSLSHLPKINLPSFSDRREDWETFLGLFVSMVHNDTTPTPVQKLYYLKGLLEGEAKAALESISINESNYSVSWQLLLSRYDNKRLLIRDHLQALTSFKPIKEENSNELQCLLDDFLKRIDALRTIGRPV